jgi:cell fate (sporulation/competence/biofilm development) regulator YmcA (YheA/YmcA/DUF963 family)
MTKLEEALTRLKEELFSLEEVKMFFYYREQIANDPFLILQQEQMKHHQKLMMKTIGDQPLYQQHKKQYDDHQEQFQNHPLVQNYQSLREELAPLLEMIKDIIE